MKKLTTLLALSLALSTAACSQTIKFRPSTVAPAAQAEVSISKDGHGNSIVQLEVKHLASPSSLTPPRGAYVVWAGSADGRLANLGAIKVDKNLSASMTTTAPFGEFSIFITAEDSPTMSYPAGIRVLETGPIQTK